MIAVDTNILVYAHRQESRYHEPAAQLVRTLAEGDDSWAIPWPCCFEFLSVVTNPRIWKDTVSTPEQAWRQLAGWMASPSLRLIGETGDFPETLERFVRHPRVRGGVVHDARIAAICVAHGARRCSPETGTSLCSLSCARAILWGGPRVPERPSRAK